MVGSPLGSVQRFELVGREVEVAAVPLVQVGGRVVDEHERDVGAAVDVVQRRR